VNLRPSCVGFVVLLGTIFGLMLNYGLHVSYAGFYLVVGAVHGCMASLACWAAISVYDFFATFLPRR
jgi:hypothetical protein